MRDTLHGRLDGKNEEFLLNVLNSCQMIIIKEESGHIKLVIVNRSVDYNLCYRLKKRARWAESYEKRGEQDRLRKWLKEEVTEKGGPLIYCSLVAVYSSSYSRIERLLA